MNLRNPVFLCSALGSALVIALANSAYAHHSGAAYDSRTEATITGTVTYYSFRNPHVYMELERKLENGTTVKTEVEAGAASVIGPLGFTRDALKVGDVVNIVGNPGRVNPEGLFLGRELYKSDGTYYPLNISSRPVDVDITESATSIAGTWFSPRTSFFGFLGGAREWQVTDKGRESMVTNGETPTPQKDCIPLGEPALLFYPVANVIEIFDDRVELHIDWLDSERVVWLDGRDHPPASETSLHGHSTGHFEGTALVVDSTNFSFNPIGFSTSLSSGTGKHLTERFEISADGKQMIYSGTMEDPEYLSAPVSWSGTWDYRPDMQPSNEMCDLETAQKFLDDEESP
ncbi:MAG: hypothetical protein LBE21_07390 [Pseudomonadales bacterium]|jgi:hypothetical protein|nr:hypothetical protein [Pseudomonadales bacterium]